VSFSSGGYHLQRSGWGDRGRAYADERWCIFDCGPLGDGGHGHYDLLNVEIAAGGRPLILDPGRHTYDEQEPNLRHWFKGTAAHNTVVVDGLDQTPYRPGKPLKGTIARGRLQSRHSAPGLDVIAGEATSTAYDAVHTRRVAFVADEYWVIEDRLDGGSHDCRLVFHLGPDVACALDGGSANLRWHDGYGWRGATLMLPVCLAWQRFEGQTNPSAGWYSPAFGVRVPAVTLVGSGRTGPGRILTTALQLDPGTAP